MLHQGDHVAPHYNIVLYEFRKISKRQFMTFLQIRLVSCNLVQLVRGIRNDTSTNEIGMQVHIHVWYRKLNGKMHNDNVKKKSATREPNETVCLINEEKLRPLASLLETIQVFPILILWHSLNALRPKMEIQRILIN